MRYSEIDVQHKIDIVSFLRNFCGISDSTIKQNVITHDDLLELFPYLNLERVPYEMVYRNPELVYTGEYLIVYDANNELVVYKKPMVVEEVISIDDSNFDYRDYEIVLPSLSKLSKDELLTLRRKARLNEDHRTANLLTNYIRLAKEREPRRYKREKQELRMNELEEGYEKIKRR